LLLQNENVIISQTISNKAVDFGRQKTIVLARKNKIKTTINFSYSTQMVQQVSKYQSS
jgi:hypothetical protein